MSKREHVQGGTILAVVLAALIASMVMATGCVSGARTVAENDSPDRRALIDRVVRIEANCDGKPKGGTGVIIEGGVGYLVIASADHVVRSEGSDCVVTSVRHNGDRFMTFRVKTDEKHDVAVLYTMDGVEPPLMWPRIEMRPALLGEPVLTFGWPHDPLKSEQWLSASDGVIASIYDKEKSRQNYRITAQIRPGSSGGPCFSATDGALLGLTVSGYISPRESLWQYQHYYVSAVKHVQDLLD